MSKINHSLKDLLHLEYLKFRNNSVVQVITIFVTVLMPIMILGGDRIFKNLPPPFPSSDELYEFPTIWEYQGYIGSWFVAVLLGFLVIQLYASEKSYRTLRQSIINGLTKEEYFLSKFLSITTISIFATILYYTSCIVIGMVSTDVWDFELMFDNNLAALRFFMMSMAYLGFAFLLSILVGRGTLTLIVYLLTMLVIEPVIRLIIVFKYLTKAPNYAPLNTIEDLFPLPLMRIPEFFAENELKFKYLLDQPIAMALSMVYLVTFYVLAWYIFKKKDI